MSVAFPRPASREVFDVVEEIGAAGVPILRLLLQAAPNDALELLRTVRRLLRERGRLFVEDPVEDGRDLRPLERPLEGQQLVSSRERPEPLSDLRNRIMLRRPEHSALRHMSRI